MGKRKDKQGNQTRTTKQRLMEDVPRGEMLMNEVGSYSMKVEELESVTGSTAYVAADGSSECGFAESHYWRMKELEKEVNSKLEHFERYLAWFDSQLPACQEKLKKIKAQFAKLHNQETKTHYASAIRGEQTRCQRMQDERDAVWAVLERAKAVLAMSRKYQFPGKKPQQQFQIPLAMDGGAASNPQGIPSGSPTGNTEVGGLLSLGPRGSGGAPTK
ncbi:hypothetical protein ACFL6U_12620 [Planctomycetota bacterium]